ncbi:MAG TPA: transposase [Ktedonobacterales bacterium]|nr:transposase [Ktedonobacterales bacterium]
MSQTTCLTIYKTFKEKLRPASAQERMLDVVLWRCRWLYNTALEQRVTAWQRFRVSISRYQQEAELKTIRAAFPEHAASHSHVLHDVLARLDKAYHAFCRRMQLGEKAGFPRFKSHYGKRYRSFMFKEYGIGARLDDGYLVLSKIGRISVHWSRPVEGTPKTVTTSKEADGWYVTFSCAAVPVHPLPVTGQETGIDLGVESFAMLADGAMIHNRTCYRIVVSYPAKCQRRVSRRKTGSARHRKAVCWLARAHQHVRRRRQDSHHKTALAFVRQFDTISHEDVQVRNMVQNHQLTESIRDAGWDAFLIILSFNAANAGRVVVAVDPGFTSQTCPGCSVIVQKGLSVRWHHCLEWGTSLQRDHNAARNFLWRGQRLRGLAGVPAGSHREPAGLLAPAECQESEGSHAYRARAHEGRTQGDQRHGAGAAWHPRRGRGLLHHRRV